MPAAYITTKKIFFTLPDDSELVIESTQDFQYILVTTGNPDGWQVLREHTTKKGVEASLAYFRKIWGNSPYVDTLTIIKRSRKEYPYRDAEPEPEPASSRARSHYRY